MTYSPKEHRDAIFAVFAKFPGSAINFPALLNFAMIQLDNHSGPDYKHNCAALDFQIRILIALGELAYAPLGGIMIVDPLACEKFHAKELARLAENDYTCPSCKNDRCNKTEKSCWKCGSLF